MIALVAACATIQQPALFRFIETPSESYSFVEQPVREFEHRNIRVFELCSQKWKNKTWKHAVEISEPATLEQKSTAILWITGDRGTTEPDAKLAQRVADISGMPVAVLYDVPNQPLFEKLREDTLIAYSFGKFLETKDETWPLLLPMVNSAVKAMDGISSATSKSKNPIRRFVVAGESKRGWTTLLTAAYDKRVIAEVPMGFDFVNFAEQLKRQKQTWGRFSPMFEAYEGLDPDAVLKTDLGKVLVDMVDPHAYMSRLYRPKLFIRGSCDPFWTIDALNTYWNELPGGKLVSVVPNVGHVVSESVSVQTNLALFAKWSAKEQAPPMLRGDWREGGGTWTHSTIAPAAHRVKLWIAESEKNDFSKPDWKVVATGPSPMKLPKSQFSVAAFVEATYRVDGHEFTLTSVPRIFPPSRSVPTQFHSR